MNAPAHPPYRGRMTHIVARVLGGVPPERVSAPAAAGIGPGWRSALAHHRGDPRGDPFDGGGGLGETVDERPHVDEALLHIEVNGHAGLLRSLRERPAVVEEDLGSTDEDEH